MKKNTIKDLVHKMEEAGENPHFIIGWMMSMIDGAVDNEHHNMQQSIDNGMQYYTDKAFAKARNQMNKLAA